MLSLRKEQGGHSRGQRVYKRTPVTNYYRSDKQPSQSPFKKKLPKKNPRKLLIGTLDVVLIVFLLVGLIYSLILKPQPKVVVSESSYRDIKTYSSQVAAGFKSFSSRNKITFNENQLADNIRRQFPEVENIEVELPFFSQEAKVRLNISPPAFKLVNGKQVYIIDSKGVAVAKAEDLPKLNDLVSLNDQSGFEAAAGQQVLSSAAVSFINTVISQTKRAKVPLASLSLPPLAQQLDLRTTDQPYFTKFYLGGDAGLQAGQFLAARSKFAQTGQAPAEYLDVRVLGKVFYK